LRDYLVEEKTGYERSYAMITLNKASIFVICLLMLTVLAGCQNENNPPDTGLANPASVYCTGLGFTEETRENEAGQYGVCIFEDGSECDSWDFLAGRCGVEQSYCAQQGNMLITGEGNIGVCQFEDGSTCEELAYFQGECKPGENFP